MKMEEYYQENELSASFWLMDVKENAKYVDEEFLIKCAEESFKGDMDAVNKAYVTMIAQICNQAKKYQEEQ